MILVTDWKACFDQTFDLLSRDEPTFLGRVGGSDTNAVAALLYARSKNTDRAWSDLQNHKNTVERYNGYYDQDGNPANFIRYLDTILSLYKGLREVTFCNYQLLSLYFPGNIHPSFCNLDFDLRDSFEQLAQLIGMDGPEVRCFPYPFVEKLASHHYTLLNVLGKTLLGKRVLVISPFKRSIDTNFSKNRKFFKDFTYPEFELVTYNTPITYSGLPPEFYPHRNWFETTEAMQSAIEKLDFDIALLSCGSYAVPLGNYIASTLGRQAIYVGGVLQLMFGVTGRRYENPFFTDQMNVGEFIRPVEGKDYTHHFSITAETAREAFGAYF